jgi:hypothetical protein
MKKSLGIGTSGTEPATAEARPSNPPPRQTTWFEDALLRSPTVPPGKSPTNGSTEREPTPATFTNEGCEYEFTFGGDRPHPVGIHCIVHGWDGSIEDWPQYGE